MLGLGPVRGLGEQVQLDRVLGLQADHQTIVVAGRRHLVDGVRNVAEVHDDLGSAAGQPLAGAQEEGHARPAPVVDLGAQRDEGLGLAVPGHAFFVGVACDRLTIDDAGAILAPHHEASDVLGGVSPQATQHLQLLVADVVGIVAHRRLHRDHAQQLQQVVLHHVAQRAAAVVVAASLLDTDLLGDRDHHARDVLAPPQRFEQQVAETQRHQVLHRLLAQIVVDAEDLAFGEVPAHRLVDALAGSEVVPERLLEHQSDPLVVQPRLGDALRNALEQVRRGRHVDHDRLRATGANPVRDLGVAFLLRQVDRAIAQHLGEACVLGIVERLVPVQALEVLVHPVAIGGVVHLGARRGKHAAGAGQRAVAPSLEERGHQLAPGEVAGAAEEDDVEVHAACGMRVNGEHTPGFPARVLGPATRLRHDAAMRRWPEVPYPPFPQGAHPCRIFSC